MKHLLCVLLYILLCALPSEAISKSDKPWAPNTQEIYSLYFVNVGTKELVLVNYRVYWDGNTSKNVLIIAELLKKELAAKGFTYTALPDIGLDIQHEMNVWIAGDMEFDTDTRMFVRKNNTIGILVYCSRKERVIGDVYGIDYYNGKEMTYENLLDHVNGLLEKLLAIRNTI